MRSDFSCGSMWMSEARGTQRFLEHRMQQLDDRRILGARRHVEQIAEFDRDVAQFGRQFLGQARRFPRCGDRPGRSSPATAIRPPPVRCRGGRCGRFRRRRRGPVGSVKPTRRRPSHSSSTSARNARLRLGQQLDQFLFRVELLEVDEGDAQLAGERLGNSLFRDIAAIDENTPSLRPLRFCSSSDIFNCSSVSSPARSGDRRDEFFPGGP